MNKTSTRDDCETIVRRMWPYLDGALPESDRERVIRHLHECDACTSHFRFAEEFLNAVRHARPESDFVELRFRVLGALATQGFVAT
jgi:anti-sigma factor (TIGR02949 family)